VNAKSRSSQPVREPGVTDARRRNMAAIRSRDTKPEMIVRSFLHRQGLRFRLHDRSLPGTPDLVLRRHKTVVFVHGCFWHHHGCANSVWPKTRHEFWRAKILGNLRRDRQNAKALRELRWNSIAVWECETERIPLLQRKLQSLIGRARGSHLAGRNRISQRLESLQGNSRNRLKLPQR
jgi:DNA mismatch endonuclease (patch repair protein)